MYFLLKAIALIVICCAYSEATVDTSGCGTTKTCVRNTENCDVTQSSCLFFSYVWDSAQNNFLMEMSGGTGGGTQYHGVGFSPDGNMQDADVYFCLGSELKSGVVRTRRTRPVIGTVLPGGISNANASTINGVAVCTFRRTASITKQISGSANQDFNLVTTDYSVIQAVGTWSNNLPEQHGQQNRWVSDSALNFTASLTSPPTNAPATTGTSASTSTAPTTQSPAASCGMEGKRCYTSPEDCDLGSAGCKFLSWTYNSETMSFNFELIGGTGANGQYAAVAFARARRMEDADLYYCTASAVTSGVIRDRGVPPAVLGSNDVSDTNAETYNGMLRCSFTRGRNVTKEIRNGVDQSFDLVADDFYILYAIGQTLGSGGLTNHGTNPTARSASPSLIDFHSGASLVTYSVSMMTAQFLTFVVIWMKNL